MIESKMSSFMLIHQLLSIKAWSMLSIQDLWKLIEDRQWNVKFHVNLSTSVQKYDDQWLDFEI